MSEVKKSPVAKQIRQIIMVLGLGALSAVLLAVGTLYYFGPAGVFRVSNLLLSPDLTHGLTFTDIDTQTRKQVHFTLDKIEYLYFDDATNSWNRKTLSSEAYKQFYNLIASDASLAVVPEQVRALFSGGTNAVLYLMVKRVGSLNDIEERRSFQEVQIQSHGDYYRIQIRDENETMNWAYYYHEGIYDRAQEVLLGG